MDSEINQFIELTELQVTNCFGKRFSSLTLVRSWKYYNSRTIVFILLVLRHNNIFQVGHAYLDIYMTHLRRAQSELIPVCVIRSLNRPHYGHFYTLMLTDANRTQQISIKILLILVKTFCLHMKRRYNISNYKLKIDIIKDHKFAIH